MDESIRLRNLQADVVVGTDGPTLAIALNAYFEAAGDKVLVDMHYVADFKILVIYSL